MADIETFGGSVISMDPLYEKQKENAPIMFKDEKEKKEKKEK